MYKASTDRPLAKQGTRSFPHTRNLCLSVKDELHSQSGSSVSHCCLRDTHAPSVQQPQGSAASAAMKQQDTDHCKFSCTRSLNVVNRLTDHFRFSVMGGQGCIPSRVFFCVDVIKNVEFLFVLLGLMMTNLAVTCF